jgi:hypothetical protein
MGEGFLCLNRCRKEMEDAFGSHCTAGAKMKCVFALVALQEQK